MAELKICRICLRTEAKMYHLDQYQLKSYYEEVMAAKIATNDNLPLSVCYECATLLHKFHKFKEKCYSGLRVFKELLWKGPITYEAIYKVDHTGYNLITPLDIMVVTQQVKYYTINEENTSKDLVEYENIGKKIVIDCSEQLANENVKDLSEITNVIENKDMNDINISKEIIIDVELEANSKPLIKKEQIYIKNMRSEKDVMNYSSITHRRSRFLDANNWKKYCLSEEEALKEFRARTEDPKYVKAVKKCTDCFKGFSKDEMLQRHIHLRHSETIGVYECRICKMRFKWDSHLRIHMRQHFTKYECLRCQFVCPLENTALLHEEYHSGVRRKCIHCGEEFRHASTYYTHLRTSHRSEYICTICGVSFVNETGLHQHKKVKHINIENLESPDDEDEVDTYCQRCDIRFDNRRAYEEHLFHSIMHTDGFEDKLKEDEITIPKKVLGKRLRAKITKELKSRKGKTDEEPKSHSDTKRKRRLQSKRKQRIPTTCHQCGKYFETQRDCMKHHRAEHPGTSFYPPNKRHVCEICGASLAPGSVPQHQNMHSKEKLFSCDTCGKQFHSSVGLRRHSVTHTGEKRFACSLCDKRFTQSNSMKLHYRTYHLKQPYPKRNRRQKVDAVPGTQGSSESSSESDGVTSPGELPELPATVAEGSKLYLTLD